MKLFRNKIFLTLILGALAMAILAGAVLYFAWLRPRQQRQVQRERELQEYRDAKREQYRADNERYADYPQYITANRGIGGDTTFDLEGRLEVSVYALKPKVAVMLIGANNMDTMFDNYEDILKGLQKNLPDTKIVLLSLTAMGGEHWGRKNQLAAYNNVTIKLLAEKYGFTFVDLYTPLYDVSIREVYEGYTTDGGHFTHQGYTVLTEQITPVLETLLGK